MRLAMAMLVVPVLSSSAAATVLHVPADYPTIGAATSVAVSGDEVLVAPGTYNERFTLGPGQDGVKIHSESGPAVTIIDGGLTGSVVAMTLVGSGTELIGFTIQHGGHAAVSSADLGGALKFDRCSPRIDNDVIKLNHSYRGAIYVTNASPSITNCVVDSNTSINAGGGIYVDSGSPAISGNTVTINQSVNMGGGMFLAGGSAAVSGNTISNNLVTSVGTSIAGGVYALAGTISGNTIANNQAKSGGGVAAGGSALFQNNLIHDNVGSDEGGGVDILSGSSTLAGNTIANNHSYRGGGIFGPPGSTFTIQNNVLRDNTAITAGGGIGLFTVSGGTVEGNQILTNSAATGAGMYLSFVATLTITNNLIQGNTASGAGGGLTIEVESNPLVENNRILGNTASGGAGGAYVNANSNPVLRGNLIQDNECQHGSGGGIYVDGSSTGTIEKNLILRNHCVFRGGGLAIWANSRPIVTSNTIALNKADSGGGNVHLRSGGTAEMSHNILSHSPNDGLFLDFAGGFVSATLSCNDVSNNAGGNYTGVADPTGTNGNVSLDPLYCDLLSLDVHLSSVSPCTAANAPAGCGLIGALDIGCEGPVRTQATTWGSLKALYH